RICSDAENQRVSGCKIYFEIVMSICKKYLTTKGTKEMIGKKNDKSLQNVKVLRLDCFVSF
ncbi:hypothetical protein SB717_39675, partial [Priestia sp. SIMBA_032]|uniref:hypothetical protein n=1 Tax=Priestia sp. SIMBA_032 TaxID=3085775 RepID=UPI00397AB757